MKILIINYGLPGFAGDSDQLFSLIDYLNLLGHKITIITTDADIYYFDIIKSKKYSEIRGKLNGSIENSIKIRNVNVIPLHCISTKLGFYCPNAKTFAKKIIKEYDLVHIYNWYYHLGMTFAQICSEENIPFIISFYAALQENAHSIKKIQKKIADLIYTKKLILKANALHSAGDLETQEYVKWGVNPNKIYRIDNAVNLNDYRLNKTTYIFQKLQPIQNNEYLLFLSRIHPKKGLDLLLHAFSKLLQSGINTTLIIGGTGSEKYERDMKTLVKKLLLHENVKFVGFVTHDEKLELLKHAKLFVLTSRSDLHPIAIQDALAMGTPVLITKACDYSEVDEYNAGLTVDSTVDSIFHGLKKILSTGNFEELSANCIKLIHERFLIENLVDKYDQMYKNTVNS